MTPGETESRFSRVYRVKAAGLAVEGIPTDDARLSGIGGASLDPRPLRGRRQTMTSQDVRAWLAGLRGPGGSSQAIRNQSSARSISSGSPLVESGQPPDHAGRKERCRTTWAPGTSRPRIDNLQIATPAGFAPVQNAVPTGDDVSRASRTLMVPTTSRHNNAPWAGPPFVTYLKLPPCIGSWTGWGRLPARGDQLGRRRAGRARFMARVRGVHSIRPPADCIANLLDFDNFDMMQMT